MLILTTNTETPQCSGHFQNILDEVHFFHFQALNLSHDGLIVKAGQQDGSDRTLLANHVPLHNYRSIYCQGLILIKSHESACVLIKHPISHVGILTQRAVGTRHSGLVRSRLRFQQMCRHVGKVKIPLLFISNKETIISVIITSELSGN